MVSTETSTVRVRPIRRFAVRFNSSLSPKHKKFEIPITVSHKLIYVEGVQNRLLHDVLHWHMNYFELKAIETLRVHEKLVPLP